MNMKHEFRDGGTMAAADVPERPAAKKGPLDEEIIEDAASRPEQFREEADRWHGHEEDE